MFTLKIYPQLLTTKLMNLIKQHQIQLSINSDDCMNLTGSYQSLNQFIDTANQLVDNANLYFIGRISPVYQIGQLTD